MKRVFVLNGEVVTVGAAHRPEVQISCTIAGAQGLDVDDSVEVEVGWICAEVGDQVQFTAPAPVAPTLGPNEFHFLWTVQEQVAIDALRATDKGIDLFMKRLEDPRTVSVVLASPPVRTAITRTVDALVAQGTIVAQDRDARLAAILAGEWPA